MRATRYLGIDFCHAHGIPFSPIVEEWALIAEAAEHEAEAELARMAADKRKQG